MPRYGSVYPWPLGNVLSYSKKHSIESKLKALQWYDKTPEEVHNSNSKCPLCT